jgi:hypothetical protein
MIASTFTLQVETEESAPITFKICFVGNKMEIYIDEVPFPVLEPGDIITPAFLELIRAWNLSDIEDFHNSYKKLTNFHEK